MSILNLAQAVLGVDHSLAQLLVVSGICAAMAVQIPAQDGESSADPMPHFVDALSHAYNQARSQLAKIARIGTYIMQRIRCGGG